VSEIENKKKSILVVDDDRRAKKVKEHFFLKIALSNYSVLKRY
jgi:hypothetical protein